MANSDSPQAGSQSVDEIIRRWKVALGENTFASAMPGQTLRPRTAIADADKTVVQTSAPSAQPTPRSSFIPKEATLAQWGEYTVYDLVGEGGMGQIFRADQGALRRDVAIKKLIPEQLNAEAGDRQEAFVSEALVTGFLDHPNIVPVYALGQDAEGQWFFSMKLVRGIAWKDLLHPGQIEDPEKKKQALAHNLDIDDRRAEHLEANLRILLSVCNAVAFAHSRNIIHRDLKPENVMVGAFGEVLVMDWGLAVDVSPAPTPSGQQRVPHKTSPAVSVGGTPDYMSPEQTFGDGASLTAQTDVFLLGAVLCELLSGGPPNADTSVIAVLTKANRCAPPELPQAIPQELREICLTALDREPKARFDSVQSFQSAVMKFLTHKESSSISNAAAEAERKAEGLSAQALALSDREQKEVYQLRFRAMAMYEQALILWPENQEARVSAERARRTYEEKDRELDRAREEERRQRANAESAERTAKAEASKSNQVATFLKDMLKGVGPSVARGRDTTMLREILDKTVERIGKDLQGQPEVEVELKFTIADVYRQLDDWGKAEAMYRDVIALRKKLLGDEHPDVATPMNTLARLMLQRGDVTGAEKTHRETLALRQKALGHEHADIAESLNNLAELLERRGDLAGAEIMVREALAMRRRLLGDEHHDVGQSLLNLSAILREAGDLAGAELAVRDAVKICRRCFGDEHIETSAALQYLGHTLFVRGNLEDAELMFREALAIDRKLLGETRRVATALSNLAEVLSARGNFQAAEELARQALAIYRKCLGNQHPSVATTQYNLGHILEASKLFDEAAREFREALAIAIKVFGDVHLETRIKRRGLAEFLHRRGDLESAAGLYREALDSSRTHSMAETWDASIDLTGLLTCLIESRKFTEAQPLAYECLRIREKLKPDDWTVFNTKSLLGAVLFGLKQYADAEPLLIAGYEGMKKREDKIPIARKFNLKSAAERLASFYEETDATDKAGE